MVVHVDQYLWSSHLAYKGITRCPEWLKRIDLCGSAHGSNQLAYIDFIDDVVKGRRMMPDNFEKAIFKQKNDLSSMEFLNINEQNKLEQLKQIASATGVSVTRLKQTRRGRNGNPERTAALYWLVFECNLRLSEAARLLNMNSSSASQTIARIQYGRDIKRRSLNQYCNPGSKSELSLSAQCV